MSHYEVHVSTAQPLSPLAAAGAVPSLFPGPSTWQLGDTRLTLTSHPALQGEGHLLQE